MRWLKFILSHSIFVSFCAGALAIQAFILSNSEIDISACLLLFFLTLGSYNMYWMLSRLSIANRSNIMADSYGNVLLGLISGAGTLIILLADSSFLPHLPIPVLLTILYSIPLWPGKKFIKLRRVGYVKTVLLALAWTYNTLFFPLKIHFFSAGPELWILFGARFFFMLMLCLIFDSRDARVDKLRSISSLATKLKPQQLSVFFILTFALFICMGFLFRFMNGELSQVIAFTVTGILTWYVYKLSLVRRGYYFYYFFVDGLMMFSAVATILASIL